MVPSSFQFQEEMDSLDGEIVKGTDEIADLEKKLAEARTKLAEFQKDRDFVGKVFDEFKEVMRIRSKRLQ